MIGFFFLGSMQLLFMGIIGEYIGNIQTQVQNRPLVFERDRVNFEYEAGEPAQPNLSAAQASDGSKQPHSTPIS